MFVRYLLITLLVLIGITCAVSLVIFLASAAIFGSFLLPLICIGSLVLFFYAVTALNKGSKV
ncbi:hypothetical protein FW778_02260 [Ginsengibacter hankyongi]|uniref:Uncharacterized protein n=1 Tax=Ginsengibacter hankyongi TaxID=2607284 RepID=A0A5J5IM10_9BACT|nr:hypothetical protein [Ginsengibacter hankyongi]KAA9040884.1 hypothetical protein FW778_02260 [Ginsengibacter hankyongi]